MKVRTRSGGLCNITFPKACKNKATWRVSMEVEDEGRGWVGFCTEHRKLSFTGVTAIEPLIVSDDTEGDAW